LRFSQAVPRSIRPLTVRDLREAAAHVERHAAESGRGSDTVFAPFLEFDRDAYEDSRYETWRRTLDVPGWERCWGAFEGNLIVGHVDLTGGGLYSTLHRARLGVGVERSARAQGVGTALIRAALGWASAEPRLGWIDLSVFEHNGRARALYERLGFAVIGRTTDAYRLAGRSIDDVHMTTPLSRPEPRRPRGS
jgi:RimJ/RimL family protein N-acetyltransferase